MKATNILREPSFLRGAARVIDIFGKLDEYKYTSDLDAELLHRDWENTGIDLQNEINRYGQKFSYQAC